jgi:signal transduction histidine kinase
VGLSGNRRPRPTAGQLVGVTALTGAVVTLAVLALPFVELAYEAPALHVMLETLNALVAILVAFLVHGRLRESGRLQDLRLVLALSTVAVANLVLTAVPDALAVDRAENLGHWAPLVVRLLGTLMLVGASLTPRTRRVTPRSAATTVGGLVAVVTALGVAAFAWGDALPVTVDLARLGDDPLPQPQAHPAVIAVHAAGVVLYAVAAAAFARQADRTADELLRWIAAGCVLAAWARVHFVLVPSLHTAPYVYTGDLLRLGFYGLLLVGAAREIRSLWRARAESAVLEDRRRIARDLHDGLIQELAYINAQSQRLTSRPGDPVTLGRIVGSAARAIDESRRALTALTRSDDDAFPVVLAAALEDLASRYDVEIVPVLDPGTEVDGPMANAMLRITSEAVRNAVRHGEARHIHVRLTAMPLQLTVTDDGSGFVVPPERLEATRPGGFGLRSMRERAEGIGAMLTVVSAPGLGTTVEVSWI